MLSTDILELSRPSASATDTSLQMAALDTLEAAPEFSEDYLSDDAILSDSGAIADPYLRHALLQCFDNEACTSQLPIDCCNEDGRAIITAFITEGAEGLTESQLSLVSTFLESISLPKLASILGLNSAQLQALEACQRCTVTKPSLDLPDPQLFSAAKSFRSEARQAMGISPQEAKFRSKMHLMDPEDEHVVFLANQLYEDGILADDMSIEELAAATLAYIQNNFEYESEKRLANGKSLDHWQSVEETLLRQAGDCEDFAILQQGLLSHVLQKSKGYSRKEVSQMVSISAGFVETEEGNQMGHVVVKLDLGDKQLALDATTNRGPFDFGFLHFTEIFEMNHQFFNRFAAIDADFVTAIQNRAPLEVLLNNEERFGIDPSVPGASLIQGNAEAYEENKNTLVWKINYELQQLVSLMKADVKLPKMYQGSMYREAQESYTRNGEGDIINYKSELDTYFQEVSGETAAAGQSGDEDGQEVDQDYAPVDGSTRFAIVVPEWLSQLNAELKKSSPDPAKVEQAESFLGTDKYNGKILTNQLLGVSDSQFVDFYKMLYSTVRVQDSDNNTIEFTLGRYLRGDGTYSENEKISLTKGMNRLILDEQEKLNDRENALKSMKGNSDRKNLLKQEIITRRNKIAAMKKAAPEVRLRIDPENMMYSGKGDDPRKAEANGIPGAIQDPGITSLNKILYDDPSTPEVETRGKPLFQTFPDEISKDDYEDGDRPDVMVYRGFPFFDVRSEKQELKVLGVGYSSYVQSILINEKAVFNYTIKLRRHMQSLTLLFNMANGLFEMMLKASRDIHDVNNTREVQQAVDKSRGETDKTITGMTRQINKFQSKIGSGVEAMVDEIFNFIQSMNDAIYQRRDYEIEAFGREVTTGNAVGDVVTSVVTGAATEMINEATGLFDEERGRAKEALGRIKLRTTGYNALARNEMMKSILQGEKNEQGKFIGGIRLWSEEYDDNKDAEERIQKNYRRLPDGTLVGRPYDSFGSKVWELMHVKSNKELSEEDKNNTKSYMRFYDKTFVNEYVNNLGSMDDVNMQFFLAKGSDAEKNELKQINRLIFQADLRDKDTDPSDYDVPSFDPGDVGDIYEANRGLYYGYNSQDLATKATPLFHMAEGFEKGKFTMSPTLEDPDQPGGLPEPVSTLVKGFTSAFQWISDVFSPPDAKASGFSAFVDYNMEKQIEFRQRLVRFQTAVFTAIMVKESIAQKMLEEAQSISGMKASSSAKGVITAAQQAVEGELSKLGQAFESMHQATTQLTSDVNSLISSRFEYYKAYNIKFLRIATTTANLGIYQYANAQALSIAGGITSQALAYKNAVAAYVANPNPGTQTAKSALEPAGPKAVAEEIAGYGDDGYWFYAISTQGNTTLEMMRTLAEQVVERSVNEFNQPLLTQSTRTVRSEIMGPDKDASDIVRHLPGQKNEKELSNYAFERTSERRVQVYEKIHKENKELATPKHRILDFTMAAHDERDPSTYEKGNLRDYYSNLVDDLLLQPRVEFNRTTENKFVQFSDGVTDYNLSDVPSNDNSKMMKDADGRTSENLYQPELAFVMNRGDGTFVFNNVMATYKTEKVTLIRNMIKRHLAILRALVDAIENELSFMFGQPKPGSMSKFQGNNFSPVDAHISAETALVNDLQVEVKNFLLEAWNNNMNKNKAVVEKDYEFVNKTVSAGLLAPLTYVTTGPQSMVGEQLFSGAESARETLDASRQYSFGPFAGMHVDYWDEDSVSNRNKYIGTGQSEKNITSLVQEWQTEDSWSTYYSPTEDKMIGPFLKGKPGDFDLKDGEDGSKFLKGSYRDRINRTIDPPLSTGNDAELAASKADYKRRLKQRLPWFKLDEQEKESLASLYDQDETGNPSIEEADEFVKFKQVNYGKVAETQQKLTQYSMIRTFLIMIQQSIYNQKQALFREMFGISSSAGLLDTAQAMADETNAAQSERMDYILQEMSTRVDSYNTYHEAFIQQLVAGAAALVTGLIAMAYNRYVARANPTSSVSRMKRAMQTLATSAAQMAVYKMLANMIIGILIIVGTPNVKDKVTENLSKKYDNDDASDDIDEKRIKEIKGKKESDKGDGDRRELDLLEKKKNGTLTKSEKTELRGLSEKSNNEKLSKLEAKEKAGTATKADKAEIARRRNKQRKLSAKRHADGSRKDRIAQEDSFGDITNEFSTRGGSGFGIGQDNIQITKRGGVQLNKSVLTRAKARLKQKHRRIQLLLEILTALQDAKTDAAAEVSGVDSTKAFKGITGIAAKVARNDQAMASHIFEMVNNRAKSLNRGVQKVKAAATGLVTISAAATLAKIAAKRKAAREKKQQRLDDNNFEAGLTKKSGLKKEQHDELRKLEKSSAEKKKFDKMEQLEKKPNKTKAEQEELSALKKDLAGTTAPQFSQNDQKRLTELKKNNKLSGDQTQALRDVQDMRKLQDQQDAAAGKKLSKDDKKKLKEISRKDPANRTADDNKFMKEKTGLNQSEMDRLQELRTLTNARQQLGDKTIKNTGKNKRSKKAAKQDNFKKRSLFSIESAALIGKNMSPLIVNKLFDIVMHAVMAEDFSVTSDDEGDKEVSDDQSSAFGGEAAGGEAAGGGDSGGDATAAAAGASTSAKTTTTEGDTAEVKGSDAKSTDTSSDDASDGSEGGSDTEDSDKDSAPGNQSGFNIRSSANAATAIRNAGNSLIAMANNAYTSTPTFGSGEGKDDEAPDGSTATKAVDEGALNERFKQSVLGGFNSSQGFLTADLENLTLLAEITKGNLAIKKQLLQEDVELLKEAAKIMKSSITSGMEAMHGRVTKKKEKQEKLRKLQLESGKAYNQLSGDAKKEFDAMVDDQLKGLKRPRGGFSMSGVIRAFLPEVMGKPLLAAADATDKAFGQFKDGAQKRLVNPVSDFFQKGNEAIGKKLTINKDDHAAIKGLKGVGRLISTPVTGVLQFAFGTVKYLNPITGRRNITNRIMQDRKVQEDTLKDMKSGSLTGTATKDIAVAKENVKRLAGGVGTAISRVAELPLNIVLLPLLALAMVLDFLNLDKTKGAQGRMAKELLKDTGRRFRDLAEKDMLLVPLAKGIGGLLGITQALQHRKDKEALAHLRNTEEQLKEGDTTIDDLKEKEKYRPETLTERDKLRLETRRQIEAIDNKNILFKGLPGGTALSVAGRTLSTLGKTVGAVVGVTQGAAHFQQKKETRKKIEALDAIIDDENTSDAHREQLRKEKKGVEETAKKTGVHSFAFNREQGEFKKAKKAVSNFFASGEDVIAPLQRAADSPQRNAEFQEMRQNYQAFIEKLQQEEDQRLAQEAAHVGRTNVDRHALSKLPTLFGKSTVDKLQAEGYVDDQGNITEKFMALKSANEFKLSDKSVFEKMKKIQQEELQGRVTAGSLEGGKEALRQLKDSKLVSDDGHLTADFDTIDDKDKFLKAMKVDSKDTAAKEKAENLFKFLQERREGRTIEDLDASFTDTKTVQGLREKLDGVLKSVKSSGDEFGVADEIHALQTMSIETVRDKTTFVSRYETLIKKLESQGQLSKKQKDDLHAKQHDPMKNLEQLIDTKKAEAEEKKQKIKEQEEAQRDLRERLAEISQKAKQFKDDDDKKAQLESEKAAADAAGTAFAKQAELTKIQDKIAHRDPNDKPAAEQAHLEKEYAKKQETLDAELSTRKEAIRAQKEAQSEKEELEDKALTQLKAEKEALTAGQTLDPEKARLLDALNTVVGARKADRELESLKEEQEREGVRFDLDKEDRLNDLEKEIAARNKDKAFKKALETAKRIHDGPVTSEEITKAGRAHDLASQLTDMGSLSALASLRESTTLMEVLHLEEQIDGVDNGMMAGFRRAEATRRLAELSQQQGNKSTLEEDLEKEQEELKEFQESIKDSQDAVATKHISDRLDALKALADQLKTQRQAAFNTQVLEELGNADRFQSNERFSNDTDRRARSVTNFFNVGNSRSEQLADLDERFGTSSAVRGQRALNRLQGFNSKVKDQTADRLIKSVQGAKNAAKAHEAIHAFGTRLNSLLVDGKEGDAADILLSLAQGGSAQSEDTKETGILAAAQILDRIQKEAPDEAAALRDALYEKAGDDEALSDLVGQISLRAMTLGTEVNQLNPEAPSVGVAHSIGRFFGQSGERFKFLFTGRGEERIQEREALSNSNIDTRFLGRATRDLFFGEDYRSGFDAATHRVGQAAGYVSRRAGQTFQDLRVIRNFNQTDNSNIVNRRERVHQREEALTQLLARTSTKSLIEGGALTLLKEMSLTKLDNFKADLAFKANQSTDPNEKRDAEKALRRLNDIVETNGVGSITGFKDEQKILTDDLHTRRQFETKAVGDAIDALDQTVSNLSPSTQQLASAGLIPDLSVNDDFTMKDLKDLLKKESIERRVEAIKEQLPQFAILVDKSIDQGLTQDVQDVFQILEESLSTGELTGEFIQDMATLLPSSIHERFHGSALGSKSMVAISNFLKEREEAGQKDAPIPTSNPALQTLTTRNAEVAQVVQRLESLTAHLQHEHAEVTHAILGQEEKEAKLIKAIVEAMALNTPESQKAAAKLLTTIAEKREVKHEKMEKFLDKLALEIVNKNAQTEIRSNRVQRHEVIEAVKATGSDVAKDLEWRIKKGLHAVGQGPTIKELDAGGPDLLRTALTDPTQSISAIRGTQESIVTIAATSPQRAIFLISALDQVEGIYGNNVSERTSPMHHMVEIMRIGFSRLTKPGTSNQEIQNLRTFFSGTREHAARLLKSGTLNPKKVTDMLEDAKMNISNLDPNVPEELAKIEHFTGIQLLAEMYLISDSFIAAADTGPISDTRTAFDLEGSLDALSDDTKTKLKDEIKHIHSGSISAEDIDHLETMLQQPEFKEGELKALRDLTQFAKENMDVKTANIAKSVNQTLHDAVEGNSIHIGDLSNAIAPLVETFKQTLPHGIPSADRDALKEAMTKLDSAMTPADVDSASQSLKDLTAKHRFSLSPFQLRLVNQSMRLASVRIRSKDHLDSGVAGELVRMGTAKQNGKLLATMNGSGDVKADSRQVEALDYELSPRGQLSTGDKLKLAQQLLLSAEHADEEHQEVAKATLKHVLPSIVSMLKMMPPVASDAERELLSAVTDGLKEAFDTVEDADMKKEYQEVVTLTRSRQGLEVDIDSALDASDPLKENVEKLEVLADADSIDLGALTLSEDDFNDAASILKSKSPQKFYALARQMVNLQLDDSDPGAQFLNVRAMKETIGTIKVNEPLFDMMHREASLFKADHVFNSFMAASAKDKVHIVAMMKKAYPDDFKNSPLGKMLDQTSLLSNAKTDAISLRQALAEVSKSEDLSSQDRKAASDFISNMIDAIDNQDKLHFNQVQKAAETLKKKAMKGAKGNRHIQPQLNHIQGHLFLLKEKIVAADPELHKTFDDLTDPSKTVQDQLLNTITLLEKVEKGHIDGTEKKPVQDAIADLKTALFHMVIAGDIPPIQDGNSELFKFLDKSGSDIAAAAFSGTDPNLILDDAMRERLLTLTPNNATNTQLLIAAGETPVAFDSRIDTSATLQAMAKNNKVADYINAQINDIRDNRGGGHYEVNARVADALSQLTDEQIGATLGSLTIFSDPSFTSEDLAQVYAQISEDKKPAFRLALRKLTDDADRIIKEGDKSTDILQSLSTAEDGTLYVDSRAGAGRAELRTVLTHILEDYDYDFDQAARDTNAIIGGLTQSIRQGNVANKKALATAINTLVSELPDSDHSTLQTGRNQVVLTLEAIVSQTGGTEILHDLLGSDELRAEMGDAVDLIYSAFKDDDSGSVNADERLSKPVLTALVKSDYMKERVFDDIAENHQPPDAKAGLRGEFLLAGLSRTFVDEKGQAALDAMGSDRDRDLKIIRSLEGFDAQNMISFLQLAHDQGMDDLVQVLTMQNKHAISGAVSEMVKRGGADQDKAIRLLNAMPASPEFFAETFETVVKNSENSDQIQDFFEATLGKDTFLAKAGLERMAVVDKILAESEFWDSSHLQTAMENLLTPIATTVDNKPQFKHKLPKHVRTLLGKHFLQGKNTSAKMALTVLTNLEHVPSGFELDLDLANKEEIAYFETKMVKIAQTDSTLFSRMLDNDSLKDNLMARLNDTFEGNTLRPALLEVLNQNVDLAKTLFPDEASLGKVLDKISMLISDDLTPQSMDSLRQIALLSRQLGFDDEGSVLKRDIFTKLRDADKFISDGLTDNVSHLKFSQTVLEAVERFERKPIDMTYQDQIDNTVVITDLAGGTIKQEKLSEHMAKLETNPAAARDFVKAMAGQIRVTQEPIMRSQLMKTLMQGPMDGLPQSFNTLNRLFETLNGEEDAATVQDFHDAMFENVISKLPYTTDKTEGMETFMKAVSFMATHSPERGASHPTTQRQNKMIATAFQKFAAGSRTASQVSQAISTIKSSTATKEVQDMLIDGLMTRETPTTMKDLRSDLKALRELATSPEKEVREEGVKLLESFMKKHSPTLAKNPTEMKQFLTKVFSEGNSNDALSQLLDTFKNDATQSQMIMGALVDSLGVPGSIESRAGIVRVGDMLKKVDDSKLLSTFMMEATKLGHHTEVMYQQLTDTKADDLDKRSQSRVGKEALSTKATFNRQALKNEGLLDDHNRPTRRLMQKTLSADAVARIVGDAEVAKELVENEALALDKDSLNEARITELDFPTAQSIITPDLFEPDSSADDFDPSTAIFIDKPDAFYAKSPGDKAIISKQFMDALTRSGMVDENGQIDTQKIDEGLKNLKEIIYNTDNDVPVDFMESLYSEPNLGVFKDKLKAHAKKQQEKLDQFKGIKNPAQLKALQKMLRSGRDQYNKDAGILGRLISTPTGQPGTFKDSLEALTSRINDSYEALETLDLGDGNTTIKSLNETYHLAEGELIQILTRQGVMTDGALDIPSGTHVDLSELTTLDDTARAKLEQQLVKASAGKFKDQGKALAALMKNSKGSVLSRPGMDTAGGIMTDHKEAYLSTYLATQDPALELAMVSEMANDDTAMQAWVDQRLADVPELLSHPAMSPDIRKKVVSFMLRSDSSQMTATGESQGLKRSNDVLKSLAADMKGDPYKRRVLEETLAQFQSENTHFFEAWYDRGADPALKKIADSMGLKPDTMKATKLDVVRVMRGLEPTGATYDGLSKPDIDDDKIAGLLKLINRDTPIRAVLTGIQSAENSGSIEKGTYKKFLETVKQLAEDQGTTVTTFLEQRTLRGESPSSIDHSLASIPDILEASQDDLHLDLTREYDSAGKPVIDRIKTSLDNLKSVVNGPTTHWKSDNIAFIHELFSDPATGEINRSQLRHFLDSQLSGESSDYRNKLQNKIEQLNDLFILTQSTDKATFSDTMTRLLMRPADDYSNDNHLIKDHAAHRETLQNLLTGSGLEKSVLNQIKHHFDLDLTSFTEIPIDTFAPSLETALTDVDGDDAIDAKQAERRQALHGAQRNASGVKDMKNAFQTFYEEAFRDIPVEEKREKLGALLETISTAQSPPA